MVIAQQVGSPAFPPVDSTTTAHQDMDSAIQTLQSHKDDWIAVSISERIALIDQLLTDFAAVIDRWMSASLQAKSVDPTSLTAAEEWLMGPYPVARNLQRLRLSLTEIAAQGVPHIPGPITTRPDGQVVAQIFPRTLMDRMSYPGITNEIWMEPGVTATNLPDTQAVAYKHKQPGKVALVLGAGNVSAIGTTDLLYKLFVENQVVLFKSNPVCAYLDPLMAEAFRALIDRGFFQIVAGGAAEGQYLCEHPGVDEVHVTGSDKTFDAIVFGTGAEGKRRKSLRQPLINKPVTGELGNVSPLIVVPGPWTDSDYQNQADQIMLMLKTNAGFNCLTTRVIVQQAGWPGREKLLQKVRQCMADTPPRTAYYPGAAGRFQSFMTAHPEAEQYGKPGNGQLPWALIADADPKNTDDICFTNEAFCSLFSETGLDANNVPDYVDRAVEFVNNTLWGTLVANIIVHPDSLKDPATAAAIDRAIANLRYGTIGVNYWGAISYALIDATWGAFPGHTIDDIQSGIGVVHNTFMFSRPQKTVLRAPFNQGRNSIRLLTSGKSALPLSRGLVRFEAQPTLGNLLGMIGGMVKG